MYQEVNPLHLSVNVLYAKVLIVMVTLLKAYAVPLVFVFPVHLHPKVAIFNY